MEKNNNIEESFLIKINLYGEDIDLNITSNFRLFCKNICKQLKITPEQLNSIILSYNDEDGDNIIISTKEDYDIFFREVKENKKTKIILIEFKDKTENDSIMLSHSNVNIQENNSKSIQINNDIIDSKDNINIKNDFMPKNLDINNNNNNNINNNSNFININEYILDDYIDENSFPNYEDIKKNEEVIFHYECSSCQLYPLIIKMYYCPKCVLYFCEECKKKIIINHNHPFITIKSKEQLLEIKKKENSEIEKKNIKKQKKKIENNKDYNNNNNNHNKNHKNNNNKVFDFDDYIDEDYCFII